MMKKQYSQSTGLRWLRISVWIAVFVVVSCFIYGGYLYQDILDKKTMGYEETVDTIIDQTSIVNVEGIELFHGKNAYHVVYGTTEDKEERIIFYPLEGAEKNITSVDTSEIISKKEILNQLNNECSACTVVKINPAIISDEILWEVTYYDKDSGYVIDYYSIYDGTLYEQYRFR